MVPTNLAASVRDPERRHAWKNVCKSDIQCLFSRIPPRQTLQIQHLMLELQWLKHCRSKQLMSDLQLFQRRSFVLSVVPSVKGSSPATTHSAHEVFIKDNAVFVKKR